MTANPYALSDSLALEALAAAYNHLSAAMAHALGAPDYAEIATVRERIAVLCRDREAKAAAALCRPPKSWENA